MIFLPPKKDKRKSGQLLILSNQVAQWYNYTTKGGVILLDREAVREFLDEELGEIEVPDDISKEVLVEAFCKYVEDDYYEWLKDNFKSFFNYGKPDWKWVRERIKKYRR